MYTYHVHTWYMYVLINVLVFFKDKYVCTYYKFIVFFYVTLCDGGEFAYFHSDYFLFCSSVLSSYTVPSVYYVTAGSSSSRVVHVLVSNSS